MKGNYDNCGIDKMMTIMTIITVIIDNGNNMNISNNDNEIKIKYSINSSKIIIRNTIITTTLIITVTNIGDSRRKKIRDRLMEEEEEGIKKGHEKGRMK